MQSSTMTIEIVSDSPARESAVAYSDGGYYVLRERSEYTGTEFCFVYQRQGYQRIRQSDATSLTAAIALIERLKKEDEARQVAAEALGIIARNN